MPTDTQKGSLHEHSKASSTIFTRTFSFVFAFSLAIFCFNPSNNRYSIAKNGTIDFFVDELSNSYKKLTEIDFNGILILLAKNIENIISSKQNVSTVINSKPVQKITQDNKVNNDFGYNREFENDRKFVRSGMFYLYIEENNFLYNNSAKSSINELQISKQNFFNYSDYKYLPNILDKTFNVDSICKQDAFRCVPTIQSDEVAISLILVTPQQPVSQASVAFLPDNDEWSEKQSSNGKSDNKKLAHNKIFKTVNADVVEEKKEIFRTKVVEITSQPIGSSITIIKARSDGNEVKKADLLSEKTSIDKNNNIIQNINNILPVNNNAQNQQDNSSKNIAVDSGSVSIVYKTAISTADEQTEISSIKLNLPDIVLCGIPDTTIDAGNPSASFLWSTGEKTQKIRVNETGYYSVTVSKGSISAIDTFFVRVNNKPILNLPDYTIICHGEDISLNAGGGDYKYNWSTGASTTSILVYERGVYYVDASNECGTTRDYSNVIFTDSCSNSSYDIPEVFTPNNDGENDNFCFKVKDLLYSKTSIYNLSGTKIFESHDNIKYWDGKVGEKKAGNGTYYYVIYAKTITREMEFRGKISLRR